MKKYIVIFLLFMACSKDEEVTLMGCSTGVIDGQRQLIRCATQQQHLAGNNVDAGGVSYFVNYKQHKWESCDQCK